jgi:hypothetical protein
MDIDAGIISGTKDQVGIVPDILTKKRATKNGSQSQTWS